jgi:hypothetical protein
VLDHALGENGSDKPFSNRSRLRISWVGSRFCQGSGSWFWPAPKFKSKPRPEGHMLAGPSARLALVLFDEALDLPPVEARAVKRGREPHRSILLD